MAVPFIVTASVCTLPPLSAVALTSTVPNNDVSATRVAAFQLWICDTCPCSAALVDRTAAVGHGLDAGRLAAEHPG